MNLVVTLGIDLYFHQKIMLCSNKKQPGSIFVLYISTVDSLNKLLLSRMPRKNKSVAHFLPLNLTLENIVRNIPYLGLGMSYLYRTAQLISTISNVVDCLGT